MLPAIRLFAWIERQSMKYKAKKRPEKLIGKLCRQEIAGMTEQILGNVAVIVATMVDNVLIFVFVNCILKIGR